MVPRRAEANLLGSGTVQGVKHPSQGPVVITPTERRTAEQQWLQKPSGYSGPPFFLFHQVYNIFVHPVLPSVHFKGDQSWCSVEGMMLNLKLQYFGHLM